MNKHLLGIIVALLLALSIAIGRCSALKDDRSRLSNNQRSLLEQVSFYRTKDSLNAASIERLTLTTNELKSYFPQLVETIKNLDIKVKRLQSVAQTATAASYPITTLVRDSIVYRRDTIEKRISLKCIDFSNPYIRLSGCEEGGVFKGSISTVDTLVQVVHRVPRKFWFIKWGTKAIRQEVVSKNPYTSIVYSEYVELR